jgi:ABC-type amino acid transport substrate-binding protein
MWIGIYGMAPYITASMTTMLTTQTMRYSINDERDLDGKRVSVLVGTTAARTVSALGASVRLYETHNECYDALKNKEVDAYVADAPILIWKKKYAKSDNIVMAKCIFDPQDYGIALREGSPLREDINIELLKLIKSDDYKAMHNRWFK